MTALLDTGVVIAMLHPNDRWNSWAVQEVTVNRANGPLLMIDIVYCESGVGIQHQSDLDRAISELGFERFASQDSALFRASIAFRQYRENRRRSGDDIIVKRVLPDMIVGAFAEVAGLPLLTTNPKDFRNYFPQANLLHPPGL